MMSKLSMSASSTTSSKDFLKVTKQLYDNDVNWLNTNNEFGPNEENSYEVQIYF